MFYGIALEWQIDSVLEIKNKREAIKALLPARSSDGVLYMAEKYYLTTDLIASLAIPLSTPVFALA